MSPPVILTAIHLGLSALDKEHKALAELWGKFGASVRKERKRRKIALKAFAADLGISPTMASYLEAGTREWTVERAELAVRLLTRREDWPD